MRKSALFGVLVVGSMMIGCARPGEIGWSPVYTASERGTMVARSMDLEGKMLIDDIDYALLLRPTSGLTKWHVARE